MSTTRHAALWTFVITSLGLFMVTLDNLVVTMALPVIRTDLGASLESLEWTVNAYTLTFAVLLLTGATLGDRFGRKRMFAIGMGIFTIASAAAALAPSVDALVVARAVQGAGGAIVMPLTLTLLSAAVAPEKRGLALGAWSGIAGLAVALGPLVGGAVVEGISWQWIFWLNVPIGLVLLPLALRRLNESYGPHSKLDLPGVGLVSAGLFGIVWGVVRGNGQGWTSFEVLGAIGIGAALVAAFVLWELRTPTPMLPMRFFRNRTFAATNVASLFMFFGMFGSIFLLAQFLQVVQGYSPLEAGLRTLPWTAMPMFISPIAGALSDRIGGRSLMATGLALQAGALAWLAAITEPDVAYGQLVAAVHRRRRRDVALLCAGRERDPVVGAASGGGPGVGRKQRHPRARGRVRSRRAGRDLRRLRRLRLAAELRRRSRAGGVGRSRGRRPRRSRRARGPRTQERSAATGGASRACPGAAVGDRSSRVSREGRRGNNPRCPGVLSSAVQHVHRPSGNYPIEEEERERRWPRSKSKKQSRRSRQRASVCCAGAGRSSCAPATTSGWR